MAGRGCPYLKNCRIYDALPDLNHENGWVTDMLIGWFTSFMYKYQFDGVRLDVARNVPRIFWDRFMKELENMDTILVVGHFYSRKRREGHKLGLAATLCQTVRVDFQQPTVLHFDQHLREGKRQIQLALEFFVA